VKLEAWVEGCIIGSKGSVERKNDDDDDTPKE
jgi:hypothetical protein